MTYQLHLVLDAEELVLGVDARNRAIWKLGDELKARDERLIVLRELVGKETLVVRRGEWKDALVLGRGSICVAQRRLLVISDGDLAEVVAVVEASRASVACKLRRV